MRRLRGEQKFADLAALQTQIAKDSAQAKQVLGLIG
ncbi:MAG: riboflavin kinase [Opitutales bacterium]